MQRSHEEALIRRLETALDTGAAFVHWSEIRRWYDIQRVAAATFRDVLEKWQELTKDKHGALMCTRGPANEGMWLFSEKSLSRVDQL